MFRVTEGEWILDLDLAVIAWGGFCGGGRGSVGGRKSPLGPTPPNILTTRTVASELCTELERPCCDLNDRPSSCDTSTR